jgi:hypothetical protein
LEQAEYLQLSGTTRICANIWNIWISARIWNIRSMCIVQVFDTAGISASMEQLEYLQVSGIARISVNICKRWNMYKY